MAKKLSSHHECMECGHQSTRWLGRCPACSAWNSFKEVKEIAAGPAGTIQTRPSGHTIQSEARPLTEVAIDTGLRFPSGISEFDRVLGGGFMTASTILLGGEPGIGKSTLLSQAAAGICAQGGSVLYANGEESSAQVRLRWNRLGLALEGIHITDTCRVDVIRDAVEKLRPKLLVVDSIQTVYDTAFDSPPGSIQQAKFGAFALGELCKAYGTTLCLVAHVTKEGTIAGPKVLEHMVDTVLYFEEAEGGVRLLRAQKNRFGATDELGIFLMDDEGLREVRDSSSLFRQDRSGTTPPGILLSSVWEGSRSFIVELQALVVEGRTGYQRLFSEKVDQRRVSRLAAILEKHAGLRLADQDLYVHVAGGLKIQDPAMDLPLAMALYSARTGLALASDLAVFGELTLAGEVRQAGKTKKRVQAALELGLARIIGPRSNESDLPLAYTGVRTIREAVERIFGTVRAGVSGEK